MCVRSSVTSLLPLNLRLRKRLAGQARLRGRLHRGRLGGIALRLAREGHRRRQQQAKQRRNQWSTENTSSSGHNAPPIQTTSAKAIGAKAPSRLRPAERNPCHQKRAPFAPAPMPDVRLDTNAASAALAIAATTGGNRLVSSAVLGIPFTALLSSSESEHL